MTDEMPLIAKLLVAVREKHHWSQQQLAQVLMVSRATIVRWESGTKEPPVYLLAALRELLT